MSGSSIPPPIPYLVERTSNRCSRAICTQEHVLIRLAGGLSVRQEQQHIESLLRRIGKAFVRMRSTQLVNPFEDIVKHRRDTVLTLGDGKRHVLKISDGKTLRVRIDETGDWDVRLPASYSKRRLHRLLWRALADAEYDSILQRLHAINDRTLQENISSFRLRFASSKWGSCSRSGVMLNTALLFLPTAALDYVILHELCHLSHPNHSKAFWNEVERWMPGYREVLKIVRGYRLTKL